jgi:hypothetical protein
MLPVRLPGTKWIQMTLPTGESRIGAELRGKDCRCRQALITKDGREENFGERGRRSVDSYKERADKLGRGRGQDIRE